MKNFIYIDKKRTYINRNNVIEVVFEEKCNLAYLKMSNWDTIVIPHIDKNEFEKLLDSLDKGDVDYEYRI